MTDGKERLKFFKVNADWVARVRLAPPTQSMLERASKITSVNTTGVFIETAMPFPVGSIIQLDITVPGAAAPVAVEGIIRYSNDKVGGKTPRGMAVEFVKGSENMQEVIKEYLQRLQEPKPAPKAVPAPQPKPEPVPAKAEKKVDVTPLPPPQPKKEEMVKEVDSELEEVLDNVAPEPEKPKAEEKKEKIKMPPLPAKKKKSLGEETKHWY